MDKESILPFEQEFKGEIVYKTPRWVIFGENPPDMTQFYRINNDITVPDLEYPLYDYQQFGVRFMVDKILDNGFVINADSVGLGKTATTIAVIKWFYENKDIKKVLVVCKKSIKKQWVDEFYKFTDWENSQPDRTILFTGPTAANRKKAYKEIEQSEEAILVTNYHAFLNDSDLIKKLNFDFIVIDEAHVVKARNGKLNNNIAKVAKGKPTVFLTGTPVMSRPEDIYGIVQIANPKYFDKFSTFKDRYIVYDYYNKFGVQAVGAKNLDELRSKTQNIVIRRTEYEASVDLPKTIIQAKECEMDSTQESILNLIKDKQTEIIEQIDYVKGNMNKYGPDIAEKKLGQLEAHSKALIAARQIASTDPRIFYLSTSELMRETYTPLISSSYKMSPKTELILDTVEDILEGDDKVILFTKFRTCAMLLKEDLENKLKTPILLYTGAESEETRDTNLDLFRNTTSYNIIIGTEALSEGVNLQCAKYVINVDQPDTLAIKTQRIGRARRIGSAFDNIIVYDMITRDSKKGTKSKDIERLENIEKNANLTDAIINIDEAQRTALLEAMYS